MLAVVLFATALFFAGISGKRASPASCRCSAWAARSGWAPRIWLATFPVSFTRTG